MNDIEFDEVNVKLGDRQARIYSMGLRFASIGQPVYIPAHGQVTTYVATIRAESGPLVLVADVDGLGLRNIGVSATNAAQRIALEIGPALARLHGCAPEALHWVALDSEGRFDRWWCSRDPVEHQPLLTPAGSTAEPRSKQAFYDAYPGAARELMLHVIAAALMDPRHEAQSSYAHDH